MAQEGDIKQELHVVFGLCHGRVGIVSGETAFACFLFNDEASVGLQEVHTSLQPKLFRKKSGFKHHSAAVEPAHLFSQSLAQGVANVAQLVEPSLMKIGR